jgi:murein L,D-transpeptidase YafK
MRSNKKMQTKIDSFMWMFIFIGIFTLPMCKENTSNANNVQLKSTVDKIVVHKSKREMIVLKNDSILKIYKIALGSNPIGKKQFQGDMKTPEGEYTINSKNPQSAYFLNLGISYPNANDLNFAKRNNKSAGGDIKIHGLPNGSGAIGRAHLLSDWTHGCIAVTNEEIKELYESVPIGTPIQILP